MPTSLLRLEGEHTDLLHRQMPTVLAGHLLSACVLVWVLWDAEAERGHLMGWLAAFSCIALLRAVWLMRYWSAPDRQAHPVAWRNKFTVGAALGGMAWGYVGWAFFHPSLQFLFPIALVLSAQISLSVPSVGVYFPAHVVFNLLTMTPFLLRNLMEDGRLYQGQSFALLSLMAACLIFSWRQQATIRESIRLRFANLDLLEQVRQENEIAGQAQRLAENANAAKSRFLAAASHDLRQPIQALNLFVEALKEDVGAGRGAEPALIAKINSSSRSLGTLLDSLLDLSRAEVGALPLDIRNVPLQPLFDRLRDEFSDQAAARGLVLRIRPAACTVRSDAALLERILRNLVANALRYTEKGGILVSCRPRGKNCRIEVRDSGIGIAPDLQQAVFTEFYQIGNPGRDRRKGLGLGLSIVDALARQLGHRVSVRSAPGRGSIFAVELPVATGKGDIEPAAESHPDRMRGLCVAIIDDDPEVRESLTALLARWGCLTVDGENADDIIAAFAATPGSGEPAAIIADWRLQDGRTGPQEVRRLHAHFGQAIPAVIFTGDTAPDDTLIGEFPVLRKPVQGLHLRATMDALLSVEATSRTFE